MKEKKTIVLERIVMVMCVVLLFITGVFTSVFVYTESDNFFKEVNNSSKENYPVSEKQISLLGSLTKNETVNITAETAGAISGSDYRVSLSGNIYYANTSTGERSNKWVVLIHGFMMSGEYCVYYPASGYVYFYNTNGNLLSLLNQSERSNSVLIQKYDTTGKLIKVFFDITSEHSYVYNPDKTYEGQWIGENFYDVNGKITDTRTKWE